MAWFTPSGNEEDEQENTFDEKHTPDQPYCDVYPHWCHTDATYHKLANAPVTLNEDETEDMLSLFGLKRN